MSAPVSTPGRRRWRRWQVAALVLFCAGTVVLIWGYQRTARVQRLIAEIEQGGGRVQLGTSAWKLVWDRIQGWGGEDPTRVKLARGTTREWLRSWDDLSDLSINELYVEEGADLGPELARLVARHPIEVLLAPGAKGADEIAAALSNNQTLKELHLRDSDLTDDGLRQLPLEKVHILNIAGTRITVDGLRELRRLPQRSIVVLDDRPKVSPYWSRARRPTSYGSTART